MLKDPTRVFRYGGKSRRDLDKDIAFATARRCWHTGERYVGTCVPATEHVNVSRLCSEICLLKQKCNSLFRCAAEPLFLIGSIAATYEAEPAVTGLGF